MPDTRTIPPEPPVPVEALVAAVPSGGKVAAAVELVARIREQATTHVVLRDMKDADVVRVLGEG